MTVTPIALAELDLAGAVCKLDGGERFGWTVRAQDEEKPSKQGTTLFLASEAREDRAMDVVLQNWRLKDYRRNPVVLADHDHRRTVGRSIEIDDSSGKLMLRVQWALDAPDPSIATVGWLHVNGYRKAGSVGFKPTKRTRRDKLPTEHPWYAAPIEVESEWGGKYTIAGYLFEAPDLHEFSSCSVGMLQTALQRELTDWLTDRTDDPADAVTLAAREALPSRTATDLVSMFKAASEADKLQILRLLLAPKGADSILRAIAEATDLPELTVRSQRSQLRGDGLDHLFPPAQPGPFATIAAALEKQP